MYTAHLFHAISHSCARGRTKRLCAAFHENMHDLFKILGFIIPFFQQVFYLMQFLFEFRGGDSQLTDRMFLLFPVLFCPVSHRCRTDTNLIRQVCGFHPSSMWSLAMYSLYLAVLCLFIFDMFF